MEGSAKFGSRCLSNYHANHAKFLRVMIHLKVLKVLKVHLFPRRGEPAALPARLAVGAKSNGAYRRLQNSHHPPEDRQFSPGGESCLIWVPRLEGHLLDVIIRSR